MLTRTACGMWVVAGVRPVEWPGLSWVTEVLDVEGDQEERDALSLVRTTVLSRAGVAVGQDGVAVTAVDVAFATLHVGDVPRAVGCPPTAECDMSSTRYTYLEYDTPRDTWRPYTVCGVLEESWQTVCWYADAAGPDHAAIRSWHQVRDETGESLLVAAVHDGEVGTVNVFGLADPWATSPEAVELRARDTWLVPGR